MNSSCSFFRKSSIRRFFAFYLILCWALGILTGAGFAAANCDLYFSLMRGAVLQPVSIVGLLVSVFLPLFLTLFSFVSCRPAICLLVCFYKAVSYGFSGMLIVSLFSSAGWLIRMLFLFSDSIALTMLFWLWLRRCDDQNAYPGWDSYICLIVCIFAAGMDYLVISPFLMGLF